MSVMAGLVTAAGSEVFHAHLMGTRFVIHGEGVTREDANEAFATAAKIDRICSDYDVTSELSLLNSWPAAKPFPLSDTLEEVLTKAIELAEKTDGAYDPTLGLHSWNWRKARREATLPTTEEIALAKQASGWQNITLDPNQKSVTKRIADLRLDLGGIAKGYAADKMLAQLKLKGLSRVSVVAGGDIMLGQAPRDSMGWKVSVHNLSNTKRAEKPELSLSEVAVSTSGDLHQWIEIAGKRYAHIVDPNTGLGLQQRVSATVIAKNSSLADGLATALCVRPCLLAKIKKNYPSVEAWLVIENLDGSLESQYSDGFTKYSVQK